MKVSWKTLGVLASSVAVALGLTLLIMALALILSTILTEVKP